ncbi:MAG: glycosyltransferase family 4 protein [Bacteroidota bacterium]
MSPPEPLRIAAFGFRSVPPQSGSAGSDTFALELYTRLARLGCRITAYNRRYGPHGEGPAEHAGIRLVSLPAPSRSGFDSLVHSFRACLHVIARNTGSVVHIHNGGNSIWALPLRLAGKRVIISQDGIDWNREKWPWYARLYLYLTSFLTAWLPHAVVFDNVFVKEVFEKKFGRKYHFIPYGCELPQAGGATGILEHLGLRPGEYFLFVGRFIPDKGLHYLLPAYGKVETGKKLVLVGGPPNPSPYERELREAADSRVIFPGYLYGPEAAELITGAYAYIQPSDIEGLSPVILSVMGSGTPLICSDIRENLFAVADTALTFRRADPGDLAAVIRRAIAEPELLRENARRARARALARFSWDAVTRQYLGVFRPG